MRPPRPIVQRRPRGTGYLTPIWTAEGWRFKARFPDGAGGERTVGTFAAEADGHRVLNASVEARRGLELPSCAISLSTWGERWIDRKADRNVRAWRSCWATVVSAAPFADWQIDAITRADVRDWALSELLEHVSERTGKRISRQTAKHALGLVRRAFKAAVDDGLIGASPAERVELPPDNAPATDAWTYLTQPEIDRLLDHPLLPPKQRSAFAVAIYAGLRQGELAALRWEHVELRQDRPRLRVVGSWDGATKTRRSRRVPLLPAARSALVAWWELQERPTAGLVWPSDKPAGAQHARGYDWGWSETRDHRLGVCWIGWRRRVGIARAVRFHDLRHTCASHLVSGTWGRAWTLEEVQAVLGHEHRDTTMRYAHLAPDALDRAAAATIRPESVRAGSAECAQALEIVGRAVRDSNARPLAPEANGSPGIASACEPSDGSRTDLELIDLLQRGAPVPRAEGEARARAAIQEAAKFAAAGAALLSAPDEHWNQRLLDLLELRQRARAAAHVRTGAA